MSYRLLILADVYPVDVSTRQFIARNPDWCSLSYSQLSERFALQHYGFTNLSLDALHALRHRGSLCRRALRPLTVSLGR